MSKTPERWIFPDGRSASRLVCGLWQVADLEKSGTLLDRDKAAADLAAYAQAGFDTFDMADHYGSAELITGRMLSQWQGSGPRPIAFTKWCPPPGPMTAEIVRRGVTERLDRLGVARVDLLQFHWWTFEHLAWLDALHELARLREEGLIGSIGVTNFDAAHLRLALADGIPVATNQVSFSLIDRRAAGDLSALCAEKNVRLLAYGTLCGGFLSERWLGQPEPLSPPDWSRAKYKRFIDAAGGWSVFQNILGAAHEVARRHGVSIANVASRWVLDHPAVAATIIGARLGENEHRNDNLKIFDFALTEADHDLLNAAFATSTPIPGDCGEEYRRPPFLTASGDLSHHLREVPHYFTAVPVPGHADRWRVSSGSVWEPMAGYSRATRVGKVIHVAGTTATDSHSRIVARGDAGAQTTFILDKAAAAIAALGGSMADVVRTRVYLRDVDQWEPVARAHGRVFGDVLPANTMLEISRLIGDYEVEIEVEAILGDTA